MGEGYVHMSANAPRGQRCQIPPQVGVTGGSEPPDVL